MRKEKRKKERDTKGKREQKIVVLISFRPFTLHSLPSPPLYTTPPLIQRAREIGERKKQRKTLLSLNFGERRERKKKEKRTLLCNNKKSPFKIVSPFFTLIRFVSFFL